MDKIARLRQEIERRLNILTNVYAEQVERKDEEMMNYYHGKVIALEELRPFLDTLSEEPDKSLEEAAEEYTQQMLESWRFDSTGCRPPRESFIAGAEWQKQQMLKDAMEGEVVVPIYEGNDVWSTEIKIPKRYELGDKIRIIIVKEDEK